MDENEDDHPRPGRPRVDPADRARRRKEYHAAYYLAHKNHMKSTAKDRYEKKKADRVVQHNPAEKRAELFEILTPAERERLGLQV